MGKYDLDKMFAVREKEPVKKAQRTYDVRVSLNKSGHNKPVVRFGFINNAAQVFGEKLYIEASDIEYTKDRVYFRTHDEKTNNNIHTLSSNSKTRQDGCYFALTPTEKGEKIYRMNWIGKTFMLYYDPEYELHYIDYREES